MIIVSICLIALVIAIAGIAVKFAFKPNWTWLNRVIVVMLAISLGVGCMGAIIGNTAHAAIDDLRDEYNHILLYYDTVNNSENEYMRFDFYERVQEYNRRYVGLVDNTNSLWIGSFYPHNWENEIGVIDFNLRGEYEYVR